MPAHRAAASRCAMVSTAPQPETMACGWARSPSAATTPSSGTTARTARGSASATAAAANAAISVTAIFPGPLATSRVSEKYGSPAAVVASDSGAGPTAKVNELLTGSPSAEITCQDTVYTPSPSRVLTGTVTTLRPRLCRGGPSPVFCPPAAVSVTGGPARVTGSLNVSVIALGDTGTAESAAGEVNSSVACADAAGARAVTSRCAIAFGTSLPGVFGWLPGGGGLPGCGAVGYQGADRGDGLGQVFAPAGPALQGPPVLAVGDGVFDADPCR